MRSKSMIYPSFPVDAASRQLVENYGGKLGKANLPLTRRISHWFRKQNAEFFALSHFGVMSFRRHKDRIICAIFALTVTLEKPYGPVQTKALKCSPGCLFFRLHPVKFDARKYFPLFLQYAFLSNN